MNTLNSKTAAFIQNHTWEISEVLAAALIEQIGGEERFIGHYDLVLCHGIKAGFRGFTYTESLLGFYDDNKDELIKFAKLAASDRGFDSEVAFIHSHVEQYGISTEMIAEGLNEVGINGQQPSEGRFAACCWLVETAIEDLCSHYESYAAQFGLSA